MAKKEPNSQAQNPDDKSFQIPETSQEPHPWGEQAATVPQLPGPGGATPQKPPKVKVKPPLPTGEYDFRREDVQRAKPSLSDAAMTMRRPVLSSFTTMGTQLLGDCAIANGLGTREPIKALVTFGEGRKWLFFMPVHSEAEDAVKITYHKNLAHINWWEIFEGTDKVVEKGYKEEYALEMTEEPISIHGVKGYALYFSLTDYDKHLISERDTVSQGSRKTAKGSSSKAKKGLSASEYQAMLEERDSQIEERDAEIDMLQKKLTAYEQKYGPI